MSIWEKWIQNREELANDACYEFSKGKEYQKVASLRNSQDIEIGDGTYHPYHKYESAPYIAEQDRIHFWVYDTYYEDNLGTFKVEIIQI